MRVRVEGTSLEFELGKEPLGRGGEALVYAVPGRPDLVAKVYTKPLPEHAAKLAVMVNAPPADPTAAAGHVSIAWPTGRLMRADAGNSCLGFVMPRIQAAGLLHELFNPRDRQRICPGFHFRYLMHTGQNLAAAVAAIHQRGYVIGDLNQRNLLVMRTALVSVLDTDSFQVRSASQVFRCPVGVEEYTPPELQGANFQQVDRKPEHDVFGLAVLIFQLLMQGYHPYAGRFTGAGEMNSIARRIAAGYWPYAQGRRVPVEPPLFAPPWRVLPPAVQLLFRRCFENGHAQPSHRPSALEWQRGLSEAEKGLTTCPANSQHLYHTSQAACPWCELTQRTRFDPFPPPPGPATGVQTPLAPAALPRATAVRTGAAPPTELRPSLAAPASRSGAWAVAVALLAVTGAGGGSYWWFAQGRHRVPPASAAARMAKAPEAAPTQRKVEPPPPTTQRKVEPPPTQPAKPPPPTTSRKKVPPEPIKKPERRDIPTLIQALKDPNAKARAQAVRELEEHGTAASAALPALLTAANDPDETVRSQALAALPKLGNPSTDHVPALSTALLMKDNVPLRLAAIQLLGRLGSGAQPALPALTQALKDANPEVQRGAVRVLGAIGPQAKSAAGPLLELLQGGDGEVRIEAARALRRISSDGQGVVAAFVVGLDDPDPEVRKQSAQVLAGLGAQAKEAVPVLVRVLGDEDAQVGFAAADALARMGKAAAPATAALVAWLKTNDRQRVAKALQTIAAIGPAAKDAAPAILPLLDGDQHLTLATQALGALGTDDAKVLARLVKMLYEDDRWQVAQATLVKIGKPAALPVAGLLSEPKNKVRLRAIETLGKMGPDAVDALPALRINANKDSVSQLRLAAQSAMLAIQRPR